MIAQKVVGVRNYKKHNINTFMTSGVNQENREFFRADIEGLRAIAVLAVLIFHLDEDWLPGGFVGVDVFLVISGFIITHQLLTLNDKGTFSVVSFWIRRIRRLYPAMLSVILLTLIIGYWVLPPNDYRETAESSLAAFAMGANVYFADRVGYFAADAGNRELLHLWSLSFEQQFYLIIPLLFVFRPSNRTSMHVLAAVVAISFAVGLIMVETDPKRAFYLPFGRFWEIALGGLVAVLAYSQKLEKVRFHLAITLLALCAIFASFIIVRADHGFPDVWALLPTLGAAALIIGGLKTHALTPFLANPFMHWHGRVSYTLYLVHWPVIVLFDKVFDNVGLFERLAILLTITYALTYAIHTFIEMPLRYQKGESRNKLGKAALICSPGIALAAAIIFAEGLPNRLPENARLINNYKQHEVRAKNLPRCLPVKHIKMPDRSQLCEIGSNNSRPSFLLIGDSHMEMAASETSATYLKRGYTRGYQILLRRSCPNFIDVKAIGSKRLKHCGKQLLEIKNIVHQLKVDHIVLMGRLITFGGNLEETFLTSNPDTRLRDMVTNEMVDFKTTIRKTVEALPRVEITIMGPVPEQPYAVPAEMVKKAMHHQSPTPLTRQAFEERHKTVFSALVDLPNNVRVVYPHKVLCDDNICHHAQGLIPLYFDNDHLTHTGAMLIQPIFATNLHDK